MSAHTNRPVAPPVPATLPPNEHQHWLVVIARTVNLLLHGKMNATASVTLNANATATTLTDDRIGPFSHVRLMPATASAATARLTAPGIYVVPGNGSAVINHPSSGAADMMFNVLVVG